MVYCFSFLCCNVQSLLTRVFFGSLRDDELRLDEEWVFVDISPTNEHTTPAVVPKGIVVKRGTSAFDCAVGVVATCFIGYCCARVLRRAYRTEWMGDWALHCELYKHTAYDGKRMPWIYMCTDFKKQKTIIQSSHNRHTIVIQSSLYSHIYFGWAIGLSTRWCLRSLQFDDQGVAADVDVMSIGYVGLIDC